MLLGNTLLSGVLTQSFISFKKVALTALFRRLVCDTHRLLLVWLCRFLHNASGLDVDLCITSRGCVFKGDVIKELVGVQKRFAGLVRLVSAQTGARPSRCTLAVI